MRRRGGHCWRSITKEALIKVNIIVICTSDHLNRVVVLDALLVVKCCFRWEHLAAVRRSFARFNPVIELFHRIRVCLICKRVSLVLHISPKGCISFSMGNK